MGDTSQDKKDRVLRRRLREAFGDGNYRLPFMPGAVEVRGEDGMWRHFSWRDAPDLERRLNEVIASRRTPPTVDNPAPENDASDEPTGPAMRP